MYFMTSIARIERNLQRETFWCPAKTEKRKERATYQEKRRKLQKF